MSQPPDDSSASGSTRTEFHTPDGEHSRKPRIEVLRSADAAPTARDASGRLNKISSNARASKLSRSPVDQGPSSTSNHGRDVEVVRGRRYGALVRSRTMLLLVTACVVIAALLVYTYVQNKRDMAQYTTRTGATTSEDYKPVQYPLPPAKVEKVQEQSGSATAVSDAELVRDRGITTSSSQGRTATNKDAQAAVAETSEEPSSTALENGDAASTVRAFYSALGDGDGASAAQSVIPGKRQSGPLSAASLSRYYSSFRRPLRVRSVIPMDANTIEVAYDYVLADGQLCRGMSAVDVEQISGRSYVSRIRTRGPC